MILSANTLPHQGQQKQQQRIRSLEVRVLRIGWRVGGGSPEATCLSRDSGQTSVNLGSQILQHRIDKKHVAMS